MTQQHLLEAIRKSLKLAKLEETARMGSVRGWDSMRHVRLMLDLERVYQVEIPPDLFGSLTSVESIASYLGATARAA